VILLHIVGEKITEITIAADRKKKN